MQCGKIEIEGSVKRLAYRVRNDGIHHEIGDPRMRHGNLHFRFEYAFVQQETNWDSEPRLRELVSLLWAQGVFLVAVDGFF